MDLNDFSDDSEERNYYFYSASSPNYHLLDILSDEKNPFLNEEIYDSDDSNMSSHLSPVQSKLQLTQNNISENEESENLQCDHEKTQKNSLDIKKTKPIQKQNEPTKNSEIKIPKASGKTKGNKSKYNNMGGFLIGSLSYFLNNRFAYRFVNTCYEVQFEGNWTQISKMKVSSERPFLEGIKKLKKQIDDLPRREGSKQHLFRLINNQPKDSELRKQFKRLIRQELLLNMRDEDWLKKHADSRDFKPNNDKDGSKKKQRHEAYLTYLNAIKIALIQTGELPKRLSL